MNKRAAFLPSGRVEEPEGRRRCQQEALAVGGKDAARLVKDDVVKL